MQQDRNSRNFSFPAQIGILIGLTGVGIVLSSFISAFLWIALTGLPIASLTSKMSDPSFYYVYLLLQAVAAFFMMFLPALLFAAICYRNAWKFLGARTPTSWKQVLMVAAMILLVFPVSASLIEINDLIPLPESLANRFKEMEESRKAMEAVFLNIDTFPKYLLSMVVIAVLPAIFEEFYFRAGLQNIFTRWSGRPWMAILITSIIFSAIHMSFYGFLVRLALGLVLGYLFYLSGSIWMPVLLHFIFNGVQVTAMYALKGSEVMKPENIETSFPVWSSVPALILLFILFGLFAKESERLRQKFVYHEPDPDDFHDWIANR